jgi:catechol 2,3-dioxygenase-like lactoylglutathione lyase family enzyme
MPTQLRVARPVTDLVESVAMYTRGLGLEVLGSFEDHDGFDGVMLGIRGESVHFEFTFCRAHPLRPTPTNEDLLVFYLPEVEAWERRCHSLLACGFREVPSFNPYWARNGRTFEDRDGYRLVIQRAAWNNGRAS